jgi:hypothetical protein
MSDLFKLMIFEFATQLLGKTVNSLVDPNRIVVVYKSSFSTIQPPLSMAEFDVKKHTLSPISYGFLAISSRTPWLVVNAIVSKVSKQDPTDARTTLEKHAPYLQILRACHTK